MARRRHSAVCVLVRSAVASSVDGLRYEVWRPPRLVMTRAPCIVSLQQRPVECSTASLHIFGLANNNLVAIMQTQMVDDLCPICLGGVSRRTTTSCGHVFCERCIGIALQRDPDSACPMCRARVTSFAVYDEGTVRAWRVVRAPGERSTTRVYRQDRSQLAVYAFCCAAMVTLVWMLGDTTCGEPHSHVTAGVRSCAVGTARCYFDGTAREAGIVCSTERVPP